MADNTTEHVVRISADTSGVDSSLERSSERMSRFERTVNALNSTLSRVFNTATTSIQNSTSALDVFEGEMDSLDDGFDDFNMRNIQSEIDRTTRRLDNLIASRDRMQFLGVDETSRSFRGLQYDIAMAQDRLSSLNSELGVELNSAISSVSDNMDRIANFRFKTQEFRDLEAQFSDASRALSVLNERQRVLEESGVDRQSESYRRLSVQIEHAATRAESLSLRLEQMQRDGTAYTPGVDTQAYTDAQARLDEYNSRLRDAQSAVDRYAQSSTESMAQAQAAVDQTAQGSASATESVSRRLMSVASGAAGKIKDLFTMGLRGAFTFVNRIFSSVINKFKEMSKRAMSVNTLVSKMTRSMTSMFTQLTSRVKGFVIDYMFREIQSNFQKLADISPRFNTAISGIIDSARQLGAQIVAGFEPIISIVTPALTKFVDMLTAGMDTISQFIARATGSEEYLKATKGQSDYAKSIDKTTSSTKKAAKAANEYKNTVLGFDQLHKMADQNDDDIIGIDDATIDSAITKSSALNTIADNIHDALASGNFAALGKSIADAVNKAFAWLDNVAGWSKNSDKFTKALKNIISTINGFIGGLNPTVIGNAIGNSINTIIESVKLLTDPTEGIQFKDAGIKLGQTILHMFDSINWKGLGTDVVQTIQAGVRFLNGLLSTEITSSLTGDNVNIGGAIGEALNSAFEGAIEAVNPEEWSDLFANIVNNITSGIINLFGDTSNVIMIADKLAETLNATIEKIDVDDLTAAINALVGTFVDFFSTLFNAINWGNIWELLTSVLSSEDFDWGKVVEAIGIAAIPGMILNALTPGLTSLGGAIVGAVAFGVSGAIVGLETQIGGLVDKFETIDKEKEKLELSVYGSADFSNLNAKNTGPLQDLKIAYAQIVGGDTAGAGMYASMTGEAVADANDKFVAFGSKIYTAQEYVDLFNEQVDGINTDFINMDGQMIEVTDQMRDVAEQLIAHGTAVEGSVTALTSTFDPAITTAATSLENFGSALNSLAYQMGSSSDVSSIIQTDYGSYNVPHFANGGIIGDGQLFIANENGAELIGSDGRGNTAVVNNEQIISAVVSGVKQAVVESGMLIADKIAGSQGAGGDIILEADGVELARAVNRGQRSIDRRGNHNVVFS